MAEDLSTMSDDELLDLYHRSKAGAVVFNLSQQAKKILLNSCYGAIGNAYFLHNDVRIARAITLAGQAMINKSAKETNDWLNRVLKNREPKDYREYSDTDSVTGGSLIAVNGVKMSIEDFWNSLPYWRIRTDEKGRQGINLFGNASQHFTSLSRDGKRIESGQIYYAMKHRVSKRMYRVSSLGRSVTVTENHSIMYKRNGESEMRSGTADILKDGDSLLLAMKDGTLLESKAWTVEDLGIQELDVYDLETDSHNFVANGILVHNSNYFDLDDALGKFLKIKPDADRQEKADFLDKFCQKIESDCLSPLFDKVADEVNGIKSAPLHMDREAIAVPNEKTGHCGIWIAKKRYYLLLDDMEGFRYTANGREPHEKIMGLFSVTSSCPEFVKPWFNRVLHDLVSEGVEKARQTISEFRELFFAKPISEISFQKGLSDLEKFLDPETSLPWEGQWTDRESGKIRNGGCPINAKAAIYHNNLVDRLGLQKKYQKIKSGDKMKYAYLKENPYHWTVIGFIDDIPDEFGLKEYVDTQTHYEKIFYKPIEDVFTACGLDVVPKVDIASFF